MALLALAGIPVLSGRVDLPRLGAWHAELRLQGDSVPSGAVQLVWDGAPGPWQATVVPGRAGLVAPGGPVEVLVVGGAGGLGRSIAGGSYRNTSARVVLEQLLGAAGERLSTACLASVVGRQLPRWSRQAGSAGAQVAALAARLEVAWRVLTDGSVWLGTDSGAALALPQGHQPTDRRPTIAGVELALASPWTVPQGGAFEGRAIEHATHFLTPDRLRTDLCLA